MSHRPLMPMLYSRKWLRIHANKASHRARRSFALQTRPNTSRRWADIWYNQRPELNR